LNTSPRKIIKTLLERYPFPLASIQATFAFIVVVYCHANIYILSSQRTKCPAVSELIVIIVLLYQIFKKSVPSGPLKSLFFIKTNKNVHGLSAPFACAIYGHGVMIEPMRDQ
jgi:hypothetical protein